MYEGISWKVPVTIVGKEETSALNTLANDRVRLLSAVHEARAEIWTDGQCLRGEELTRAVGAVTAHVAGAHRVAVAIADPIQMMIAVAGVIAAGAAAVPLAPMLSSAERAHILQDSAPDVVIDELNTSSRAFSPGVDYVDNGAALIMYTSGSTGQPKGVVLSRRAIAFNLDALTAAWEWTCDDVVSHGLPPSHVAGLIFGVLGPFRVGSPLAYSENGLRPVARATMYFGIPTMWSMLTDGQLRDLHSARLLVSGASTFPRAVYDRIERVSGHRVLDRYALTETMVNTTPRVSDRRGPGLLGRPLPGIEVEIRDIGIGGGAGEVVVRGANLLSGYVGRPSPVDADGWFSTGDLGKWDGNNLRLVGRKATDLIKTAGHRVGAAEVEQALLTHPAISDAAVIGMPDDALGERVVAWVVLSEPAAKSELLAHAAELLSPYKRPLAVHAVDSLPRNRMGKIQKSELREAHSRPLK